MLWSSLSASQFIVLATVLGLLVGSFLNVVVYRLPVMLYEQWQRDAQEALGLVVTEPGRLGLCEPSCCRQCGARIRAWHNVPVLSYLMLGGRSACCHSRISPGYPLVEGACALISMAVAWRFGASVQGLSFLVLSWSLLVLGLIDARYCLLPDVLVLPCCGWA